MSNRIAPKLLAEFIGTFSFVFIGAGTAAVVGSAAGLHGITAVAFAHGLAIMAFAFAYGSVSGGHMNPAVTVGVLAAGAMSVAEAMLEGSCPQARPAREVLRKRKAKFGRAER